jgi:predicted transcriptional regulator
VSVKKITATGTMPGTPSNDPASPTMAYPQPMQQKKITFRAPAKKINALDSLARTRRLTRTQVLNEAIDEYLALNEQWKAQIKEGIRQCEAGETIPHEEVLRLFASRTSQ